MLIRSSNTTRSTLLLGCEPTPTHPATIHPFPECLSRHCCHRFPSPPVTGSERVDWLNFRNNRERSGIVSNVLKNDSPQNLRPHETNRHRSFTKFRSSSLGEDLAPNWGTRTVQGQEGKSKNGKKDSTPTITTTNDY